MARQETAKKFFLAFAAETAVIRDDKSLFHVKQCRTWGIGRPGIHKGGAHAKRD